MTWPAPRIVHLATLIAPTGAVSALCFKTPRPIDLARDTWTNRPEAVTCLKCTRLEAATHGTEPAPTLTMQIATLPKRLRDALGLAAINQDMGASRAALKALERRGLVESYQEQIYGTGNSPIDRIPATVTRYAVPLPIHIAWCAWCSTQVGDLS